MWIVAYLCSKLLCASLDTLSIYLGILIQMHHIGCCSLYVSDACSQAKGLKRENVKDIFPLARIKFRKNYNIVPK